MTALSVFERRLLRKLPTCERCDNTAWATTPSGYRCEEHAVAEVKQAVAENNCDWMPRLIQRRRV